MELSVVIVSYNVKKLLRDCLDSIINHPRQRRVRLWRKPSTINYEVIVVDNHSDDGSGVMVKKEFTQVKLIASRRNLGFGKANNLGAKEAKGNLILFLNPDTRVCLGSLEKIVNFFKDFPKAGIVGPRLLNGDGGLQPSVGSYPSLSNLVWEKPIDFLERRFSGFRPLLGKFLVKYRCFNQVQPVAWVTGAALVCRRDVWEKLGGFDEEFFMYFEDIDFCLRAQKAGWQIYHLPEAKIYHLRGKSQPAKSRKKAGVYYQSQDYYFCKHKGRFYSWLVKIIRWPYQVLDLRTKVGRYY